MEGRCRRCGEKLSLLQRLQGQDFCSPEHKAEFQREQEEMALARLQQTASNLKKPEAKTSATKTALREISSPSHSAIELRRETEPPMASFFDHWSATAEVPPLPPELEEEALTVLPKVPSVKQFTVSAFGASYTQIPLSVQNLRGDVITILSPRTSSIVTAPPPAIPAWISVLRPFPWAAKAMILDQGPPEAGLVQITSLRPRVHEPMVRWLEPVEEDLPVSAPSKPGAALETWSSPGLGMSTIPASLSGLLRGRDWTGGTRQASSEGGAPAGARPSVDGHAGNRELAARLAPGWGSPLPARFRFGYRRPRRVRIEAAPEGVAVAPAVHDGARSILSPMLAWPASPARRLTAGAAKASKKPLPHFAAVPVPVRPSGYGYTPDLTPIAITANWLAAKVPVPVSPSDLPRPSAPSPCLQAEFTPPAPNRSAGPARLDDEASNWVIPPAAPRVGLEWRISANTALLPASLEGAEEFSSIPRIAARLTSMRAAVPSMRRRIKMEVRLEPPKPAPWFEPLTCAFGGDPYGSR